VGGIVADDEMEGLTDGAFGEGDRLTGALEGDLDGAEAAASDLEGIAGAERGAEWGLVPPSDAPAAAVGPEGELGVRLGAGDELDAVAGDAERGDHGEGLAGDPVARQAKDRVREGDLEDVDVETVRELDVLTLGEDEVRQRLSVEGEAASEGQQLELAAAEADHRVGLADAGVVDGEGRAPEAADEVTVPEVVGGAVREGQSDEGEHGGTTAQGSLAPQWAEGRREACTGRRKHR
jgi:hypothetical protein